MFRKIGLLFLSLWLLFFIVIIITVQVPHYCGKDWQFVGFKYLIANNMVPIICIIFLILGIFSYVDFKFQLKGSPRLSFTIKEIENVDYEHLTFLTTYIVPLVCFNFDNNRYIIAFCIILFVIGAIYIRTDLFYANPSLALLKFKIYSIQGEFRSGEIKHRILISRDVLNKGDRVKYIELDERIYYAFKIKTNE